MSCRCLEHLINHTKTGKKKHYTIKNTITNPTEIDLYKHLDFSTTIQLLKILLY